ncbi:hypothetical protein VP01_1957g4 [Puccinia sorghi]|uniref:Uncharacterized protein n=1 Tax=Puccinia sorghi TaxID=27349 RepID=A0A0L6VDV6_9BASI|nr:hypothetical protein VP01_1957g4 [Puccinia sorghi]
MAQNQQSRSDTTVDNISHKEFKITKLFNMHNDKFKQMMRTTEDVYVLFSKVCLHPTFISTGSWPELPVPHQLALTLERFGAFGNCGLLWKEKPTQ